MNPTNPADLPDDDLEALVRDAVSPVTDAHRAAALGAFAWRDLDAELAQLVESANAPLLRSDSDGAGAEQLTYSTSEGTIVIDVEQTSATTTAVVVFAEFDPEATGCFLVTPTAERTASDMADGTAVFAEVTAGSTARFEIERNGTVIAVTPWMTI